MITLIILLAAGLHAGWNALLRVGTDKLWSMTVMCISIALVCGGLALVLPMPARVSWGLAILSAFLHVGYNLFLVRTYRSGDLGQTYPIARGSSPLLVTLGAAVFAGELPDPIAMAGVLLVSGGIISLAFQGRRLGTRQPSLRLGDRMLHRRLQRRRRHRRPAVGRGARIYDLDVPAVGRDDAANLRHRPRLAQPYPRAGGNVGSGGRRYRFTRRLWSHHICHVAWTDGASVGSPRNQRGVRRADRPLLPARTADHLPHRRLHRRCDRRGLHRPWRRQGLSLILTMSSKDEAKVSCFFSSLLGEFQPAPIYSSVGRVSGMNNRSSKAPNPPVAPSVRNAAWCPNVSAM